VQLRSGGSIVFAQTEALVAIDVNSGRATKERHIEETAYKTNMEAADEIARQLRLRDLAGLVVIDFIDMEDNRNNHAVERRLKEALKADRARIQVGRISHFGLLELSRQRLRPSLIEANFRVCSHCAGSGLVRSTESAAVYSLRMLEEEGGRQRSSEVTLTVHPDVAIYLLNYKRESLASIEGRYRIKIIVLGDPTLVPPNIRIDRVKATRPALEDGAPREALRELPAPVSEPDDDVEDDVEDEDTEAAAPPAREPRPDRGGREGGRDRDHNRDRDGNRDGNRDANREANREGGREGGGRKRRRRRRRGGAERGEQGAPVNTPSGEIAAGEGVQASDQWQEGADDAQGEEQGQQAPRPQGEGQPGGREDGKRGRRRGRRGGRRRRRGGEAGPNGQNGGTPDGVAHDGAAQDGAWQADGQDDNGADTQPTFDTPARSENQAPAIVAATAQAEPAERDGESESAPTRFFRAIKKTLRGDADANGNGNGESAPVVQAAPVQAAPPPPPVVEPAPEPSGPPRRGWWKQDE
jgi:ribonuclease E